MNQSVVSVREAAKGHNGEHASITAPSGARRSWQGCKDHVQMIICLFYLPCLPMGGAGRDGSAGIMNVIGASLRTSRRRYHAHHFNTSAPAKGVSEPLQGRADMTRVAILCSLFVARVKRR